MGLSNKYVGESRRVGKVVDPFTADWCHLAANAQSSALADDEADQISVILLHRADGNETDLTQERQREMFREVYEEETAGRELEEDEENFLSKNPGYIVVDI